MKKRFLFFALPIMALLSFVSCGDNDEETEKKDSFDVTVSGEIDNHSYVDLGLPSGIKWATCNIGANNPRESGDQFAWGETKTKTDYGWDSYKWGSYPHITKYITEAHYGEMDYRTVLEPADDAATANWGRHWRMPTKEELQELIDGCNWEDEFVDEATGRYWIPTNEERQRADEEWSKAPKEWESPWKDWDVYGIIGTSKSNGNTIYIPWGSDYWSSTTDGSYYAYVFREVGPRSVLELAYRSNGYLVRAVVK